jgi:hypothetical protein
MGRNLYVGADMTREEQIEAALAIVKDWEDQAFERDARDPMRAKILQEVFTLRAALAAPATAQGVDVEGWESLVKAADALTEQAAHVAQGGCIPAMNIHGSARELMPLVNAYEKAREGMCAAGSNSRTRIQPTAIPPLPAPGDANGGQP